MKLTVVVELRSWTAGIFLLAVRSTDNYWIWQKRALVCTTGNTRQEQAAQVRMRSGSCLGNTSNIHSEFGFRSQLRQLSKDLKLTRLTTETRNRNFFERRLRVPIGYSRSTVHRKGKGGKISSCCSADCSRRAASLICLRNYHGEV